MAKTWKDRRVVGESLHRKITRRRMEKEHSAAAMFVFLSPLYQELPSEGSLHGAGIFLAHS